MNRIIDELETWCMNKSGNLWEQVKVNTLFTELKTEIKERENEQLRLIEELLHANGNNPNIMVNMNAAVYLGKRWDKVTNCWR